LLLPARGLDKKELIGYSIVTGDCLEGGAAMCECCSNQAEQYRGHIHVNGVECADCVTGLEKALTGVPGVISLEYAEDREQVKVNFDKRIIAVTRLEEILKEKGFTFS
jgi:copper chaperone CopZ